jgi:ribose-phosphate pyrophosphokinase
MLFVIEKLRDFEIDVLLMYFPFGRTENGVNFIANLLKNMGVKHITSVDMHTSHERIHNINLAKFWRNFISDEYVIVAPDKGAVLRSGSLYHLSLLKKRLNNTVIITWNDEIFDIKEKNCMIVDDMIDTGKTVVVTSNFLIENGAKSVSVCATHAVLSEDASQLIQNSKNIEKVYTTDTIEHKDLPPKYQIVPILEYVFSGLEYI